MMKRILFGAIAALLLSLPAYAQIITGTGVSTSGANTWSGTQTFADGGTWGSTGMMVKANGAASLSPLQVTGTWYVAGSATTNYPAVFITGTGASIANLNTNGSGLVVNAPSGFSASGSLFEAFTNGVSKFSVGGNGDIGTQGSLTVQGASAVFGANAGQINSTSGLVVASTKGVNFSSTSGSNGSPDAGFWRDTILGAGNVDLGNGTANDKTGILNLASLKSSGALIATGSAPTGSGTCTRGAQTGGNTTGTIVLTCTAQTLILTFTTTAPTGWMCEAIDQTTVADTMKQTSNTTTSCTLTGTTAASDVVIYQARAY